MLKHGILGLLSYEDRSGYEIKEFFESSLNHFWTAQTSQIYREIGVLEKNGWIKKETIEQDGKPNKNICSITEDGRQELHRWLSELDVETDVRIPTLMKTFFLGELPLDQSLHFFRELQKEYRDRMEKFQETDEAILAYQKKIKDQKNAPFWQLTADFGRRYTQMYLDWIENCIQILEEKEDQV